MNDSHGFPCHLPRPLIFGLIALFLLFPVGLLAQAVNIPDANLESVVRDALEKPTGEITQADMESLTELTARGGGVVDLAGSRACDQPDLSESV